MHLTLTQAMARREGFGQAGARATRNSNPLNIEWGPFARRYGATGIETIPAGYKSRARFAYFPDTDAGFAAAKALLSIPAKFDAAGGLIGGYMGATLRQVIARWAPPIENDTEAYLRFVCSLSGLTADTVLTPEML